jgi:glycosyltransferase involved in cell wall biosynthesis
MGFYPIPVDRFRTGLSDVLLCQSLRSLFGVGRFDLVHAMTIKPLLFGGLAARSLPKERRPAFVGTIAGLGRAFDFSSFRRSAVISGLKAGLGTVAGALTFENEFDAEEYVRSGIVDMTRVRVMKGAGVDLDLYKPSDSGLRGAPVRFLFASRLLRSKGVLSFVEAARLLKAQFADEVQFSVAGVSAPNEPDGLSATELAQIQGDPSITWLGAVPGNEIPKLLIKNDVFVLPTSYPEGLPRSLLEAGACRLAVIAGDVPGTRALIKHGQDGILLADTSAVTVAQAMAKLFLQPDLRHRLAFTLQRKVESEGFSLSDVNGEYLAIYDGLRRNIHKYYVKS